jgi:hypothetical protein
VPLSAAGGAALGVTSVSTEFRLKNNKPTIGFITEGGLGSLRSISSLLRVLPTHRRSCIATTETGAEFYLLIHFDITIIVR